VTHRAFLVLVRACLPTAAVLVVAVASANSPQEPPGAKKDNPDKPAEKDADDENRRAAEQFASRIEVEVFRDDAWVKVKRIDKPLLFHADPTRGHNTGSVWGWGETGRPVALLELWRSGQTRTKWSCSLCNTSGGKVRASRGNAPWWRENDCTSELIDVPGAPAPAADAAARQRQLKLLAQKFTGHEFWDPDNTRYELRRLDRPLHTYRDEAAGLLDGSLYTLANGTNPELMLFVEARADPTDRAKAVWRFAVGRSAHAEFHLEYDGKEVLSGPRAWGLSGPDKPYWVVTIDTAPPPEPKE
jgi:hypothetical protein